MGTQCAASPLQFHPFARRAVVARSGAATLRANQLRPRLASFAHALPHGLRRLTGMCRGRASTCRGRGHAETPGSIASGSPQSCGTGNVCSSKGLCPARPERHARPARPGISEAVSWRTGSMPRTARPRRRHRSARITTQTSGSGEQSDVVWAGCEPPHRDRRTDLRSPW